MAAMPGRLLAFFRTLAPPTPDSDAELLRKFAQDRDETALDGLVRRYAGLVMGVCRRRFANSPDADDAFQATFLVLAQHRGTINHLPAWLHRVAMLTCLKLSTKAARRGTAPMETEPPDLSSDSPDRPAELRELKAVLDDELAELPEKFRSVLALCCLDGLTNAQAAERLGVPIGTIDSRLHSAKSKLRGRLIQRGIAGAATASLTLPLAGPASEELIRSTVTAAAGFALGHATASPLVTALTHEVSQAMTTFKFKLLAGAAIAITLAGGTGLYMAQAGPQKASDTAQKQKATPPKAEEPKEAPKAGIITSTIEGGTTAATTAALSKPADMSGPIENMSLLEVLSYLSEKTGATFRADTVWLTNVGAANPYEHKIDIKITKGLSVSDILDEICLQLPSGAHIGYRVKGNQVIIGQKFIPPSVPGNFGVGPEAAPPIVEMKEINKMLYGPTVTLSVKDKSLMEIVDLLREQTGANIVVNKQYLTEPDLKITITLNDTKLFTVLKVVGDLNGLSAANVDNVFYLTGAEKADQLNRETSRTLFGDGSAQQTVMVPVDKDGKFVPHRAKEMNGGAAGGPPPVLVPVNVDEPKAKKSGEAKQ